MYPVSDEYKAAIAENVRTFRIGGQIKLKSGEIIPISDATVSDKEEIKIDTRAMSSDDDMSLGYCGSATLSMYIIDDNTSRSYGDAEITLTCGLQLKNGEFEDIPMGIFYVNSNSVKRQRNMFKITAYDAMVKLQYALTETMRTQLKGKTAYQAAAMLCNGNMAQTEEEVSAYPNGDLALDFSSTQIETARDAVMWCGHLMGCFTCIDRFGKLKFEQLQPRNFTFDEQYIYITPERTMTADQRFKTEFSETRFQIFKLVMRDKDNEPVFYKAISTAEEHKSSLISYETEQNPLVIGQETRSVADVLKNIVSGALHRMAIQPFKASVANDPALEVRDYIRMQSGGNIDVGTFSSMLTHSVWRYRGRQDLISSTSMQMVSYDEGTEVAQIATIGANNAINPIASEEKTYVQPRSQIDKRAANAGGGGDTDRLVSTTGGELRFYGNGFGIIDYTGKQVFTFFPNQMQMPFQDGFTIYSSEQTGFGIINIDKYGIHNNYNRNTSGFEIVSTEASLSVFSEPGVELGHIRFGGITLRVRWGDDNKRHLYFDSGLGDEIQIG